MVAGLFLSNGGIWSLLRGAGTGPTQRDGSRGELPDLVMILFDELATAEMLDADGAIDRETLPNFARLAERPRVVTPGNRGEILPVPLFIKRPGQQRGNPWCKAPAQLPLNARC